MKIIIFLILGFTTFMFSQESPVLKGEYLGQTPPGLVPEVFARGIVSSDYKEHGSPTFSADGKEVFWWSIQIDSNNQWINMFKTMRCVGDTWTEPEVSQFNEAGLFSPDGKRLYFGSKKEGDNPYFVEKKGESWGDPIYINLVSHFPEIQYVYFPTITSNGTLYFLGYLEEQWANIGIYRSELINGEYSKPELLPEIINTRGNQRNWTPYIAPDESYLIFCSTRGLPTSDQGDLYICFRKLDGSWMEPVNMGQTINSDRLDRFPSVSPDGKYFFYTQATPGSNEDVYWVSAEIIENFRKQSEGEKEMEESPVTEAPKIDESLAYSELQSQAIEHYRNDRMDTAILYMEYAQKKFPENDMQTINILAQLYTRDGQYAKAVAIWKQGIEKGFFYDLNNPHFQQYYKDDPDFAELAKIEKDKTAAAHILHEVLLPENYDNNQLYPVLFIFHGNSRNIELAKSVWKSETMTESYISVFVQSYVPMGKDNFQWLSDDEKTDKEFKDIYENIMTTYSVDTDYIILAGMSAGGRKAVQYAFNELVPTTGLVLNCPVIPTDISEEAILQFVEKNKRIGIITGGQDFALSAQKKLLSDIDNLNGITKMYINEDLGHTFAEDFSLKLDEYLKWVIK